MRRLCRSPSLPPTHSPKLTRIIHTTSPLLRNLSFTDDSTETHNLSDGARVPDNSEQVAYAREVGERGLRRWQESQDPQKRLQFMTMGREFTIPYNLTEYSYMSLNHMRELRAYYRKMMYEMPQFRGTCPRFAFARYYCE